MWRSALFLLACAAARAQDSGADPAALGDFQKRIGAYLKLHEKAGSSTGKLKPTPSPDHIAHHESELAHKIREMREHAGQGNIFTAEIAAMFRRMIGSTAGGRDATTVHQSLRRSEPVAIRIKVNRAYPEGLPLQTTPPSLLQNLPRLPAELEYRVVGRALVLRDVGANLIVDYLPDAMP